MDDCPDAAMRVVDAARRWIGTPYVHAASARGAGADCLGLIRGVWREIHGGEPEPTPAYTPDWSEASREERLWAAARRRMAQIDPGAASSGDVLLLRMREAGPAKHLGVLARDGAGAPTMIHAYSGRGVVESPLGEAWARRVVAVFRIPEGVR